MPRGCPPSPPGVRHTFRVKSIQGVGILKGTAAAAAAARAHQCVRRCIKRQPTHHRSGVPLPFFQTPSASIISSSTLSSTHCVAECCGHNLEPDLPWPWWVNSHCRHLQWLLAVPGNGGLDLNGLAWGRVCVKHAVGAGQTTGRAGIAEADGPTAVTELPTQADPACAVGQSAPASYTVWSGDA